MSLGVAVLGTGRLGGRYIDVVKSTPGVRIAAVAEPRADAAAPWKEKHPDVEFVSDYKEVLERDDIDIVIAALPHWLHREAAIDAARARKHVYVEKPMAAWLADAEEMLAEARANGVKVMTAHTQRYFPAVKAIKRIIDSADLGTLVGLHDIWHFPYRPTQRPDWMLDRELGGGMGQMAVTHQLDRLIWFAGDDVVSVSARVGALTHPEYDKSDDSSFYLVRWKSGIAATINQVGWRRGATEYGGDLYFTNGMARFRLPYGSGEAAKRRRSGLQTAPTGSGVKKRLRKPTASSTSSRTSSLRSNGATRTRRSRRNTAFSSSVSSKRPRSRHAPAARFRLARPPA